MAYQVTGNEYVSLPSIREADGTVEGIACLYMQAKGMLELRGSDGFIKPYLKSGGEKIRLEPNWERTFCWIPSFTSESEALELQCIYLTPVGERGIAIRMQVENRSETSKEITIGLEGEWAETLHTVNESAVLEAGRQVKRSDWNHMFVFQQIPSLPLLAFAPIVGDDQPFSRIDQGAEWRQKDFSYDIYKTAVLQPHGSMVLDVFFGLGYEEVSAAASAKEMLRQGFDRLLLCMKQWLEKRCKRAADKQIETLLNTNLFFAFFYASGRTIDTEELCMMTSRSPRYYVSAAYWDRDSLLWAFPAILEADSSYAKELLLSVFRLQSRNFGVHSRYIDGTVLEPGFELDELCAPVLALERYIAVTGDKAIVRRGRIEDALEGILQKLNMHKHAEIEMYSTFLQPTDDMHNYPYLTYDNVLAWKTLCCLGNWLDRPQLLMQAERVRLAIRECCTVNWQGKRVFAWSVDLDGHWDIYDEPPGSLQLLPFYGFCSPDDDTWRSTIASIRDPTYPLSFAGHAIAEIGCRHAPHPWVLSICNSLLSGHEKEALLHLRHTMMDNGIACESIHEDTGECATGAAFATCAGFLAYALGIAAEKMKL